MNETTAAPGTDAPPAGQPRSSISQWLAPFRMLPTPVIFLGAAALACLILWRQGSVQEIGVSLRAVSAWKVLGILAAYTGSVLILGWRWHVLARLAGGEPPWTSSVEVFLTSVIVNYAAPIGLAVPTRAALSVRDLGLSAGQSAAVVGWELGLDLLALLAIAVAWLVLGGSALLQSLIVDSRSAVAAVVILALAAAVLVGCLLISRVRSRLRRLLRPAFANPRRSPALALGAAALTALFWGAQTTIMSALLTVFGIAPTPPLVLGMMGFPILIGMLSPVPGGAGIREGLMTASARLEGVAPGPVLLAAITYRLALFVVTPIAWGVVRLLRWSSARQ